MCPHALFLQAQSHLMFELAYIQLLGSGSLLIVISPSCWVASLELLAVVDSMALACAAGSEALLMIRMAGLSENPMRMMMMGCIWLFEELTPVPGGWWHLWEILAQIAVGQP